MMASALTPDISPPELDWQVPCGGWELVASFAEEVAAIAEPLRLSDHKRDQRIASAVRPTAPPTV